MDLLVWPCCLSVGISSAIETDAEAVRGDSKVASFNMVY